MNNKKIYETPYIEVKLVEDDIITYSEGDTEAILGEEINPEGTD